MLTLYVIYSNFYYYLLFLIRSRKKRVKYCDRRVCVSVCLFAHISQEPLVQISPNFMNMLNVAVARSSSDGSAISYTIPVLRMPLCFHNGRNMHESKTTRMFCPFRQVAAPGAKSAVSDCILFVIVFTRSTCHDITLQIHSIFFSLSMSLCFTFTLADK